jgi:hypothetical protein
MDGQLPDYHYNIFSQSHTGLEQVFVAQCLCKKVKIDISILASCIIKYIYRVVMLLLLLCSRNHPGGKSYICGSGSWI